MVLAHEHPGDAFDVAHHRRAAVPAGVHERPQLSVGPAHEEDRREGDVEESVRTGFQELRLVRCVQLASGEQTSYQ